MFQEISRFFHKPKNSKKNRKKRFYLQFSSDFAIFQMPKKTSRKFFRLVFQAILRFFSILKILVKMFCLGYMFQAISRIILILQKTKKLPILRRFTLIPIWYAVLRRLTLMPKRYESGRCSSLKESIGDVSTNPANQDKIKC